MLVQEVDLSTCTYGNEGPTNQTVDIFCGYTETACVLPPTPACPLDHSWKGPWPLSEDLDDCFGGQAGRKADT